MMRAITVALFLTLLGAQPAEAVSVSVRYTCSLNYDGTCDTAFPAGDKPDPGASCPTGWTCSELGVATGEIDEVSPTAFDLSVSSPNDWDSIVAATKNFASGDVQVCATIPARPYGGYVENFTDFGVTIQEGLTAGAFWFRAFMPSVNDIVRRKAGTETSNSSQQCTADAGTAIICATHDEETDTFQAWQSLNGTDYITCGDPVQRDSGALDAGVWGTSQEAGQTSTASLTGISATDTITVVTPAAAPTITVGPTLGTPTTSTLPFTWTQDQAGSTRAVLCANGLPVPSAEEVSALHCDADAVPVDSFEQIVAAGVSDSDQFIGLNDNTTFDAYFVPISSNGPGIVYSALNVTTDDETPPTGEASCPLAPFGSPNNATTNTAERITTDVGCRTGDDIVLGRDLSVPPDARIGTTGGLFDVDNSLPNFNQTTGRGIQGNRLWHCKIKMKDIEPVNDNADPNVTDAADYDWDVVDQCIADSVAAGYDGVLMHFRHSVLYIDDCTDTAPAIDPTNPNTADADAKKLTEWTSPSWLTGVNNPVDGSANYNALTGCHAQAGGFRIRNVNLDDDAVRAEIKEFIRAFGAQSYKTRTNLRVVMHVASSSSGEECCVPSDATVEDLVQTWATAFGANAGKVAFLKEDPASAAQLAISQGMGMRGGIIENCLRNQYLPGNAALTGQVWDSTTGYLTISPTFAPINSLRHWMDELEFHTLTEQPYFFCAFRAMQMRRSELWIVSGGDLNGRLDNWMSTIMGHRIQDRAEGWMWLLETRFGTATSIKKLVNFESGIRQRETLGATVPTNKVNFVEDLTGNAQPPPTTDAACNFAGNTNCRAAAWSRSEANGSNVIGFSFDDLWWPTTLTHDAVLKATYYDTGSTTCRFRNASGTNIGSNWSVGSSGTIRTVTRHIDNLTGPGAGEGLDLQIHCDATVAFSFLRVIKNGGTFPQWNE